MQLLAEKLHEAITTGIKLAGGNDTDCFLYTKKGKLYVVFTSPLVTYAKRISAEMKKDFPETCIDANILAAIIGNKKGNMSLDLNDGKIIVKTKTSKASLDTITKIAPADVLGKIFSKRPEGSMDVSELSTLPTAIKKVFASVRDNVSNEELSVRAKWEKSKLKILVADGYHGVLLTSDVKTPGSAEIILPLTMFLRAISIQEAQTFIEETSFTTVSKSEYLTGRLKATSNSFITVENMENLFVEKSKFKFDVSKDVLSAAFASCKSLSDTHPIIFKPSDSSLTVTMRTESSQVSETVSAHNMKGKPYPVAVNVKNFSDLMACMGTGIIFSCKSSTLYLESTLADHATVQAGCVLHMAGED